MSRRTELIPQITTDVPVACRLRCPRVVPVSAFTAASKIVAETIAESVEQNNQILATRAEISKVVLAHCSQGPVSIDACFGGGLICSYNEFDKESAQTLEIPTLLL